MTRIVVGMEFNLALQYNDLKCRAEVKNCSGQPINLEFDVNVCEFGASCDFERTRQQQQFLRKIGFMFQSYSFFKMNV